MSPAAMLQNLPLVHILVGALVLLVILGIWVWFEYRFDPRRGAMERADGTAFRRGLCGDAMEISLKFAQDRVVDAKYWTDGCRMSGLCGATAAKLALDRTPEEIGDIDYVAIEREVGGLPEEDLHCATLAAGVLQEALRDYLTRGNVGRSSSERSIEKKTSVSGMRDKQAVD